MVEPQYKVNKKSTNRDKIHRDDSNGAGDKQDLGSKKVRLLIMT
jgi:hypothetical protein